MKNNFTISQRNAIVENHLWCIKAVMKQNRALIRAAKLDTDDVYQQLALRLIRAVMSFDPLLLSPGLKEEEPHELPD